MAPLLDSKTSALTPADFQYLRSLVRDKSAIVLDDGKEYLVESRLSPLLRKEGLGSLAELVQALRSRKPGLETKVIDAMTTNETSFFRDIHPFNAMKESIIPEIIEKKRAQRELNLWCAAASSGQEPYSVCMMLRENFPELASWRFNFLATDLSPSMIEKSKSGRYSQLEVNRGLPAAYLVKYFERQGADWVVKPDIRSMVDYRLLNLVEPWPMMNGMDIVFIRNVLIYFDRETKKKILQNIKRVLRPDGYLMLGSSETTFNIDEGWAIKTIGKTICYQPGK
ncbi:MAG: protein-glutamate O-methyltransferase CheR [Acidimicrobiia bacterium]